MRIASRYKSGFVPPEDIPFVDLSKNPDAESTTYSSQSNLGGSNLLTQKGTISANKLKKRVGIFGIFGSNKVIFEVFYLLDYLLLTTI